MTDVDLFRFEVPTSAGKFVVIGPDTLPPDEAARIGAQIARLIPLMVLEPEADIEALLAADPNDEYPFVAGVNVVDSRPTHPRSPQAARDGLPVPDWGREGETWRVEAEPGWEVVDDGVCLSRGCFRRAVVYRPRNPFALCAVHVRKSLMWIENGQLVSWVLRPVAVPAR